MMLAPGLTWGTIPQSDSHITSQTNCHVARANAAAMHCIGQQQH